MAIKYIGTEHPSQKSYFSGLSSDTPTVSNIPGGGPLIPGSIIYDSDTNGIRQYNGTSWAQISTGGSAHVRIKADDTTQQPVYGSSLQVHVVGTPATKVAFTSGDIHIVDMRSFGKATLSLYANASTMSHQVDVAWSFDGGSETHSSTNLWTAQTGDKGAAMTILDNFAHVTYTRDATSETIYSCITGRELA